MKHALELQQAGSGDHYNGRCSCGQWTIYPGRWHDSKKNVKKLFADHVQKTSGDTLKELNEKIDADIDARRMKELTKKLCSLLDDADDYDVLDQFEKLLRRTADDCAHMINAKKGF